METLEKPLTGKLIGKVETDMFCAGCGYNLHMLDVTLDDRLGIPIVQCPECGKFHPAGIATGAGRVWLNRLASFLILHWVLFLTALLVAFGFGCGIADVIKVEAFVRYHYQENLGPGPGPVYTSYWGPAEPRDSEEAWAMFVGDNVLNAVALLLGFLAGGGMATFLPHLKRRWGLALIVVPMIAMGIVGLICYDDRHRYMPGMLFFFVWRFGLMFTLQSLGIAAGARFGRSVARGILRVVLSRRLLQYVRPVWEADGKEPPAVRK
ncbi:MAG TPA: hypothetical protein VHM90_20190 [Phycisphaerae bacterium]|nr:hypothetical protein [Phycisphaerae bacterium]